MYIVLYETMYNKNVCCHYIRRYIMRTNISLYKKMYIVLYETMYNDNIYLSLYKKIYNDNKHFLIHENVYRVIQEDV